MIPCVRTEDAELKTLKKDHDFRDAIIVENQVEKKEREDVYSGLIDVMLPLDDTMRVLLELNYHPPGLPVDFDCLTLAQYVKKEFCTFW